MILLVEDDRLDADLVRRAMKRSEGTYCVERAATLAEGIDLAKTGDFDVILTDLGLPDAIGFEPVARLRLACRDAAIIALSGRDDEAAYLDALSNGADDFLCKNDLSSVVLHRCIQQNLHRAHQRAEIRGLVKSVEEQARQLTRKNARLEQLCDSSQKFVNNVSHEFRTPLCVIKQYSSLIADAVVGPVNEEQGRMLRVIEDRVDDLNNMVDDMLDISRHEAGLLAASRESCDARQIIDRILPGLQQRALLREIDIRLALNENLPPIYCDPEKVSRTLINLIVNAVKFSPPGSTIDVVIRHRELEGEVDFAIVDAGPGIEPNQCKAIFERFRQTNTSLRGPTKGFGLGLNIAKELVELNLGEMSLQSVVGSGSTFSFTVPVDDACQVASRYLDRRSRDCDDEPTMVSLVSVSCPESISETDTKQEREIHLFLNFVLRSHDLGIQTRSGHWLLILHATESELDGFIKRLDTETVAINRNRPQGPLPDINTLVIGTHDVRADRMRLEQIVREHAERPRTRPRSLSNRRMQHA